MKSVFSGILILLCWCNAVAQLEKGVNVQLGVASIHSGNLKNFYSYLKDQNSSLTSANAHSNFGGYVGFGGRLAYPLNDKFSLMTELNLSYQSSKIFLNQKQENLDVNNTGTTDRISSETSVKIFNASIPLLVRYQLSSRKYYVFSGFTFNFSPHPILKSNEEEVKSTYNAGIQSGAAITDVNSRIGMNKFNPVNVMFTLGFEKRLKRGLRNISVSVRGNYALTKSQMYTNSDSYFNSAMNNVVFTGQGQSLIQAFSGIKLNDFRMGSYYFTITYHIAKKTKEKK